MGNGITIKDVARVSGVSLATVSRVINGTDMVSDKTKEKVMDAVKKLGYNPNSAARALVSQKTNAIGIVVHNLHDPFFYDLIKGFETGAQHTGSQYPEQRKVSALSDQWCGGCRYIVWFLSDRRICHSIFEDPKFFKICNDRKRCERF